MRDSLGTSRLLIEYQWQVSRNRWVDRKVLSGVGVGVESQALILKSSEMVQNRNEEQSVKVGWMVDSSKVTCNAMGCKLRPAECGDARRRRRHVMGF